jgi:pimeloyl-ACP methyl ester carboxylesterase
MPKLTVDGGTLHYLERGEGTPLVLLHAYPLTGACFAPQLDALADCARVIVPDLRGFGGSSPVSGPLRQALTVERLAQDVLALLEALGLPQAVVGGVSLGGYVAMAVLREDPSRVRGLVLMDTQALADDEAAQAQRERSAQAALERGIDAVVEAMLPKLLAPTAPEALRHQVEAMIRQNRPETCAAMLRGMALRPDRRELLSRFGGPSRVVHGEQDTALPWARAEQMAELLSVGVTRIEGAGHLPPLEQPQAVNAALRRFLQGR